MLAPASDRSRSSILSLLRGGFPLVLIDRALPDADCDLIVSDNANGARRLIEHLIGIGHREIAHVTDAEDTSTGRERLRGYRDALDAAGIPFQSELVVRTTVDRIGGYRAAQEILTRDPLPTAIFAVNNMTAVGTMEALRERGLSVPRDMGLVCFDDVEHLAVLSPFLTVIDQPAETFGSLGAQLLLIPDRARFSVRRRRVSLRWRAFFACVRSVRVIRSRAVTTSSRFCRQQGPACRQSRIPRHSSGEFVGCTRNESEQSSLVERVASPVGDNAPATHAYNAVGHAKKFFEIR